MRAVVSLVVAFLVSCAGATQPIRVQRSAHVNTNATAMETDAILDAMEAGLAEQLTAERGGLRRAVLQRVQVDEHTAIVHGCGTFYDLAIRESFAITLVGVRRERGWGLHSWQVDTEGLHGPRKGCTP